jgi:hypothetical protein
LWIDDWILFQINIKGKGKGKKCAVIRNNILGKCSPWLVLGKLHWHSQSHKVLWRKRIRLLQLSSEVGWYRTGVISFISNFNFHVSGIGINFQHLWAITTNPIFALFGRQYFSLTEQKLQSSITVLSFVSPSNISHYLCGTPPPPSCKPTCDLLK